jgi:hypothetical protein
MSDIRYPQYEMIVNGKKEWLNKRDTVSFWDSGWCSVKFGEYIIDKEGSLPRQITEKEKQEISNLADEYSASK